MTGLGSVGRVLVAGGTGFVGRAVCDRFAAAGTDVAVIARAAPSGSPYRFRSLDLAAATVPDVTAVLDDERPDVVVDAVGSIWGLADEEATFRCTEPGLRLLAAVSAAACRPRLVHLGSVLEYGPAAPDGTLQADSPPRTAYGRAKLAVTEAVTRATADGAIDGLTLRIANVAGPGTPAISLLGKVATSLADAAARDEPATVSLTPMSAHRDYVHVQDVADAVLAAATVPAGSPAIGAAVDIGCGSAVPVRSLVELLIEVSGVPTHVVETGARAAGHPDWIAVDPEPARRLLGWEPRRTVRDAVEDLWSETAGTAVPRASDGTTTGARRS
jgi:nucleoside-diphosphate-sugar epimerase